MGSVFVDFAAQGQCFVKVALAGSNWWPCALMGMLVAWILLLWTLWGTLAGSIWLPRSLLGALPCSIWLPWLILAPLLYAAVIETARRYEAAD